MVRISMPKSLAANFVEDARLNYYDSRWLKIAFEKAMYDKIFNNPLNPVDKEVKDLILEAKNEVVELVEEYYKKNKW